MTTTLSQSQVELPRLVELASQGEDVIITVEGKPKARLTRADTAARTYVEETARQQWSAELAELRAKLSTGKMTPSIEQLIEEDRAER